MNNKKELYLLASHGSLATGMLSAINMIYGKDDRISAYDLDHYESPDAIYKILTEIVESNPDTNIYIVTDILGGSVQNALLHLAIYDNASIVTGMNLGLVLSLLTISDECTLQEKCERAIADSTPSIQVFSKHRIMMELEKYGKKDELWSIV